MVDTPDFEYVLIDSTISKVHADATGAKGGLTETLLSGLRGIGHVIADAAHEAEPLRDFIANDLGAVPQIKANPSRATAPATDWRLYKERHQVEYFFNKPKRFRRIALL